MSIFYCKEQDGTMNVRVSGYVTKDPKVTEKVVLFSVCYGKQKYMDCKAWVKDSAGQIASYLERHDPVAVDGVYEEYKGRDGQIRRQISVDGIFPMSIPAFDDIPRQEDLPPSSSTYEELADTDGGELPF